MGVGFNRSGSSDSYVLLGGGGHKLISDFAGASHSHDYLPLTGGIMNGQVVLDIKNRNISVDDWVGLWIKRTEAVADAYSSGIALTAWQNNGFIIGGGSGSFSITKLVGTTQTECIRIPAWNMNVGIGISSPSYKLHVNGDAGIEGNLTVNSGYLNVDNGSDSSIILHHNTGYDATYIIDGGQRKVGFQLGSGGTNTGFWDYNRDIWLLYIDNSNNARFAGSCAAYGFNNISDIRIKNIIEQVSSLNIYDIANSPIFKFKYKNCLDGEVHVGTSAQYWQNILPDAVTVARDDIGTLSLQYDVAALASAISIAKKTVEQEHRINMLESEVQKLKNKINELNNK